MLQVSAVGSPPTPLHAPCQMGGLQWRHNTTHCLSQHKRNHKTAACCPNCGGKHHAWNLSCPSRKAQVSRIHNCQQAKHPKAGSKKEEKNQGKKGKQRIRKKQQPTQKPQAKPCGLEMQSKKKKKVFFFNKTSSKKNFFFFFWPRGRIIYVKTFYSFYSNYKTFLMSYCS